MVITKGRVDGIETFFVASDFFIQHMQAVEKEKFASEYTKWKRKVLKYVCARIMLLLRRSACVRRTQRLCKR